MTDFVKKNVVDSIVDVMDARTDSTQTQMTVIIHLPAGAPVPYVVGAVSYVDESIDLPKLINMLALKLFEKAVKDA
jgi:hypothetical protein